MISMLDVRSASQLPSNNCQDGPFQSTMEGMVDLNGGCQDKGRLAAWPGTQRFENELMRVMELTGQLRMLLVGRTRENAEPDPEGTSPDSAGIGIEPVCGSPPAAGTGN